MFKKESRPNWGKKRTELGIEVGRKMMMYSSSSECRSIRYRPATGVKDVIIFKKTWRITTENVPPHFSMPVELLGWMGGCDSIWV
jgi:hypothetical protein